MTTRQQELDFLTGMLANTIRSMRFEGDALAEERLKICLECEMHFFREDRLRCEACGCADPTRTRPRCPVFKW